MGQQEGRMRQKEEGSEGEGDKGAGTDERETKDLAVNFWERQTYRRMGDLDTLTISRLVKRW